MRYILLSFGSDRWYDILPILFWFVAKGPFNDTRGKGGNQVIREKPLPMIINCLWHLIQDVSEQAAPITLQLPFTERQAIGRSSAPFFAGYFMKKQNSLDENHLLAIIDFENAVPCVQILCICVSRGSTKHPSLVKQQGIADSCREDQDKFSATNKQVWFILRN